MSIYEYKVPFMIYGAETHAIFADNEEEAREKLRKLAYHAAYGREVFETEYLFTDAELMPTVVIDPPSCYECPCAFEADNGEAACTLTIDECGFRYCEDIERCPKDAHIDDSYIESFTKRSDFKDGHPVAWKRED